MEQLIEPPFAATQSFSVWPNQSLPSLVLKMDSNFFSVQRSLWTTKNFKGRVARKQAQIITHAWQLVWRVFADILYLAFAKYGSLFKNLSFNFLCPKDIFL